MHTTMGKAPQNVVLAKRRTRRLRRQAVDYSFLILEVPSREYVGVGTLAATGLNRIQKCEFLAALIAKVGNSLVAGTRDSDGLGQSTGRPF